MAGRARLTPMRVIPIIFFFAASPAALFALIAFIIAGQAAHDSAYATTHDISHALRQAADDALVLFAGFPFSALTLTFTFVFVFFSSSADRVFQLFSAVLQRFALHAAFHHVG